MDASPTRKMKLELINRQNLRQLNTRGLRNLARSLMQRARSLDPRTEWRSVSLVLTDDAGIQELNQRYFGRDEATDVITKRFGKRAIGRGMGRGG